MNEGILASQFEVYACFCRSMAECRNCPTGCCTISLMTHNDNLDALRFYQRRGFHICGIDLNSMEKIRKLKPCIPLKR